MIIAILSRKRHTSDAKEVSKEAYIINMPGQQVTTVAVNYNPLTESYDAIWHGRQEQNGVYLFHAKTTNGPVASKIVHKKNMPSIIPACRQGRDYGAGSNETSNNQKSSKAIDEDGDGASHYIISITHEGLEDFIDTVLVQENQFHDFFFHPNPVQYADGNVQALIFYDDLTGSPNSANVEYKRLLNQSTIFNTTATNGAYQITVPIIYEPANPGETKYIVTISENGGDPFVTEIDTILVTPGVFGITHYVSQIPEIQKQDIEGIVRNVYTKALESGVTVRVINRITGELIEEDITGPDGKYSFEDILAGTKVEFELGKSGELWMVNTEYDIPDEIMDTLVQFNRYFYPKTVEVPQVGTNTTIEGDGEEIAEITGYDIVNFEEILRGIDYMWANGPTTAYWTARTWIQDNFYQGDSPITTTNTQRDITNEMQEYYEPYTNFYPGQLGWNVNFGQGNLTSPLLSTTNYGVTAIIGGEIMTTEGGNFPLAPVLKELEGRRLGLGNVLGPALGGRPSMMNATASMPDEKDRAYVHLILINQHGRFKDNNETYSLEYITSIEPSSKSTSGIGCKNPPAGRAGKPLPGAEYRDVEGNKPHSKMYFNKEKYREQLEFQRQERIKSFLQQQLYNKASIQEPETILKKG